jgi:hypothetical protein
MKSLRCVNMDAARIISRGRQPVFKLGAAKKFSYELMFKPFKIIQDRI